MKLEELEACYQLANSYMQLGNPESALKEYERIIDDSRTPDKMEYLFKGFKGKLDVVSQNKESRSNVAATMLSALHDHGELAPQVLFHLSQFFKSVEENDRALQYLELLDRNHPKNSNRALMLMELGSFYQHQKKDIHEAIKKYTDFLNEFKKHKNIKIVAANLAACYNAQSKPEQAKKILKRYFKIG